MSDFQYRGHLPQLDALRGIAILLVLVVHSPAVFLVPWGWCGVDLFFVLSGFLITGILVDTVNEKHYFRNFYARRSLRIWPLYYLVVALGLGILPALGGAFSVSRAGDLLPWYVAYLQNFGPSRVNVLGVTWSLAIEEQFYFVWPLVVVSVPRRALLRIAFGIVLASPALRYILLSAGVSGESVYQWSFTRADGLAAGAVIALLVRSGITRAVLARWSWLVLFGGVLMSIITVRWGFEGPFTTSNNAPYALGFSGLSVTFAALLGLALTSDRIRQLLDVRFLRHSGRVSYGLYVYHPIVYLAARTFGAEGVASITGWGWAGSHAAVWPPAIGATFLVAQASFRWVETPLLALKRFFEAEQLGYTGTEKAETLGARGETPYG